MKPLTCLPLPEHSRQPWAPFFFNSSALTFLCSHFFTGRASIEKVYNESTCTFNSPSTLSALVDLCQLPLLCAVVSCLSKPGGSDFSLLRNLLLSFSDLMNSCLLPDLLSIFHLLPAMLASALNLFLNISAPPCPVYPTPSLTFSPRGFAPCCGDDKLSLYLWFLDPAGLFAAGPDGPGRLHRAHSNHQFIFTECLDLLAFSLIT